MTDYLVAVFNSAVAMTDHAFSSAFQLLWLQILFEHRRYARRDRAAARIGYFS
jgi:hypothetical protein